MEMVDLELDKRIRERMVEKGWRWDNSYIGHNKAARWKVAYKKIEEELRQK